MKLSNGDRLLSAATTLRIEIELLEPTSKGWKVATTTWPNGRGKPKTKTQFLTTMDIERGFTKITEMTHQQKIQHLLRENRRLEKQLLKEAPKDSSFLSISAAEGMVLSGIRAAGSTYQFASVQYASRIGKTKSLSSLDGVKAGKPVDTVPRLIQETLKEFRSYVFLMHEKKEGATDRDQLLKTTQRDLIRLCKQLESYKR